MNKVFPFKPGEVDAILGFLEKQSARDYTWFFLGCNTALRVGDLLSLKVGDVAIMKDDGWRIRGQIDRRERKTGKFRTIYLNNPSVVYRLKQYLKQMNPFSADAPLFPSRKHNGRDYPILSRAQAWRIIQRACEAVGIDTFGRGTHSMRKTFVRRCIDDGYSIDLVQDLLGHTSQTITLRYCGFTEDNVKDMYKKVTTGIKRRGKYNR